MDRLVTVARCGDVNEAEVARLVLGNAGIRAVVAGGDLSNTLSHLAPAIGDVLVQTTSDDADRARQIIGQWRASEAADQQPWHCPTCQHNIDPNFDLCWKCGSERSGIPAVEETQEPRRRYVPGEPSDDPFLEPQPHSDPYAPPHRSPAAAREFLPEGIESVEQAEEIALRALRAAIIGLLLLPPLLSLYAISLLLRLWTVPLSEKGLGRVRWAWALAMLGCLFGAVLWAETLR